MCTDCEQNKNQALLHDVEFEAPNCDFTVEEVLAFEEKLNSAENTFNPITTNSFLGLIETVRNNNRYLCVYQDRFQVLREAFTVNNEENVIQSESTPQPESGTTQTGESGTVDQTGESSDQ